MRVRFTKMHGAGNDFVVLDESAGRLGLSAAQYRWLADRHFGVGADQILSVRAAHEDGVDFEYAIHNADGGEVEQCGNGARCFLRFVHERGLSAKQTVRVRVGQRLIELQAQSDGRVTVDMGAPAFEASAVPFLPSGLTARAEGDSLLWPLLLDLPGEPQTLEVAVLSMGNPHAVVHVDDVDRAPVALWGPALERHVAFPRRVNAGFMQVLDRRTVRLRVHERGAGETLACGTGACAAAVAGMALGWLDDSVDVHTRGGVLTIAWQAQRPGAPVMMTGPAATVFEGEVEVPNLEPDLVHAP